MTFAAQLDPLAVTVILLGALLMTGSVLSSTVIVCTHMLPTRLLPGSTAVHVLSITEAPLQGPVDIVISVNVMAGLAQLVCVATPVAVPVDDGEISPVNGHLMTSAGQVILGAAQQLPVTVTLNIQVDVFPQKSVAVYVTGVVP